MSIVLVIIGLIVGGILTGQDLINAAAIRAQVSQIEKYQTAVRTFQGKYNYLPGDIPDPYASNFGFQARGTNAGQGDGNWLLEGVNGNGPGLNWCLFQIAGETVAFWNDLSTAGLIDGGFSTASPVSRPGADVTGSALNNWFPQAKIGNANYIYTFSYTSSSHIPYGNFFGIAGITKDIFVSGGINASTNLTVAQAYNIDKKMDDGFPESGAVWAIYVNYAISTNINYAAGGALVSSWNAAAAASSTTCFDDNNLTTNPEQYSMSQNGGSGMNCALAFKFQ